MPLSMLYWVLVLLWALVGGWQGRQGNGWAWAPGWLIMLLILIVIGLMIAGSPIKGG